MSRVGKPDPHLCVCATLRKATRSITQIYDTALRPSGLRATQFHILGEIYGAGEAAITELTRVLVIDQTTLTRSVALLERDGLLSTVPKLDARLKVVRLTEKGIQTMKVAFPLWHKAQTKMLKTIGSDAWEMLHAQLNQLR